MARLDDDGGTLLTSALCCASVIAPVAIRAQATTSPYIAIVYLFRSVSPREHASAVFALKDYNFEK